MRHRRPTLILGELTLGFLMHWSYLLRDPQSGTAPCGTASTRFEGLSCAVLRSQSLGFTLIELMMVILVSAILAMIAIPSFQELLAKSRVNGSVNLLTTSFDLARSEALSKNRVTVLCRSGDPMAVAPTCIATGLGDFAADDWATGWIIYSKPANFDASIALPIFAFDSSVDQLVRRILPFANSGSAKRMTMIVNPNMAEIAFSPSGTRVNAAGAEPTFTVDFRVKSDAISNVTAKCVSLNLLGRAAITNPATSSC